MNLKQRRIILNAKIKTHVYYVLPLVISQPQYVRDRFEKILMKINRWILMENTFRLKNTTICKRVGVCMLQQELLRTSFKFIHNLILERKCRSITELFRFPQRTSSRISHKTPKKQFYRTPLEHMIELYNQQTHELKLLTKPRLKRRLEKTQIKYKRD